MKLLVFLVVLVGVAVAVAACGGSRPVATAPTPTPAPTTPRLTPEEGLKLAEYEYDFAKTALDESMQTETTSGVAFVIRLCRAKAAAVYDDTREKRTVMQFAEDAANTLRGVQPLLAASLDRVLDDKCQ